jgi:uncharacterized protein (DUF58 family)
LGVGFAAVNTANNLLFLVLGMMLGLIVMSGILSEATLRGVRIARRLPARVQAKESFPVELALTNTKRRFASFGVELKDEIEGESYRRRCFFLRVGPGEERAIAYRCELPKRGKVRFDGTVVSTRFPFGLFEKSRFMNLEDEVIVLPAQVEVALPGAIAAVGDYGSRLLERGAGQEFRELRERAPDEDPRRIHWRTTARVGKEMVRLTEVETEGLLEIVLDPGASEASAASIAGAERAIELAASLARLGVRRGLAVRLVTTPPAVFECRDREQLLPLLEHLALLDTAEAALSPAPLGQARTSVLLGVRAGARGAFVRLDSLAPASLRSSFPASAGANA